MVVIPARTRSRYRGILGVILGGLAVTLVAVVSDHPAVAEVFGGAMITWIAILAGLAFVRRAEGEDDPGRELLFDFLLALAVFTCLIGVGVMAAAIPWMPLSP